MFWMAAGCAALFALLALAAYHVGPTASLDETGLTGFVNAHDSWNWAHVLPYRLARLGNPPQVALITLALAALALVRGRPRVALAVIALVAATSISGQILKQLLAYPRHPAIFEHVVGPEAFPSGHATAAMSLALATVFVAPQRARIPAAIVGSLIALAVGGAVIALGWHYPSDVIGGYLLATGWALAIAGCVRELNRRVPASDRWSATGVARFSDRLATGGFALVAAGAVAATALAGAGAALAEPSTISCYAREHTTFLAVAGMVASTAVVLPVAMATVSRRGG
jgi:membrane-associated phospholipid phosphatase